MSGPCSCWKCFRPFALLSVVPALAASASAGSLGACSISDCTPDGLNENLHSHKSPSWFVCTGKCEKPISSQQSHLPSLSRGVLNPFEVPVLCSTVFGVSPLRGGPLGLAITGATCKSNGKFQGLQRRKQNVPSRSAVLKRVKLEGFFWAKQVLLTSQFLTKML